MRTDPLWIDVPVPLDQAAALAVGRTARVRFPRAASDAAGKVIRISRLADAARETLEVRVEVPNGSARPAGEQVAVTFPATRAATQPAVKAPGP